MGFCLRLPDVPYRHPSFGKEEGGYVAVLCPLTALNNDSSFLLVLVFRQTKNIKDKTKTLSCKPKDVPL